MLFRLMEKQNSGYNLQQLWYHIRVFQKDSSVAYRKQQRNIKVKSSKHGKNTSKVEITNISEHGFWIFCRERKYFLPFEQFPWFKNATIQQISDLRLLHGQHLYWPELDVDLSFNIIENPEKYKLIAKQRNISRRHHYKGRSSPILRISILFVPLSGCHP